MLKLLIILNLAILGHTAFLKRATRDAEDDMSNVVNMGNGNLTEGVNAIIKQLEGIVDLEIKQLDDILQQIGANRLNIIFRPILQQIEKATGLTLSPTNPVQDFATQTIRSGFKFVENSTRGLLENVLVFDDLAVAIDCAKSASVNPNETLAINLVDIDKIYLIFQQFDQSVSTNLQNLLTAQGPKRIEAIISCLLNLVHENINLQIGYAKATVDAHIALRQASNGSYSGQSVENTVANLKSPNNRHNVIPPATKIIDDIQKAVGDSPVDVDDFENALKTLNIDKIIDVTVKFQLQVGLRFLTGVNRVASTDLLANIAANTDTIDPEIINTVVSDAMEAVSTLFKPFLGYLLKLESAAIKNPSLSQLFTIVTDYISHNGDRYVMIIKEDERLVNDMVANCQESHHNNSTIESRHLVSTSMKSICRIVDDTCEVL